MAQDSIILPEISADNFEHAWKRFRLAAVAKQWQAEKAIANFTDVVAGQPCRLLYGPWRGLKKIVGRRKASP